MPSLRFTLPRIQRLRGAGLGNELPAWAKAIVAARHLGATPLHPAWGLNRRRYWRYFRSSRLDWLAHAGIRAGLPRYVFTEEEFRKRQPLSLVDAIGDFCDCHRLRARSAFVVEFPGMWGGLEAGAAASDVLMRELMATRWTAENLYALRRLRDPKRFCVGLHIRRGDFIAAIEGYRGKFNVRLPMEWYTNICRQLFATHADAIEFLVFGESSDDELAPFLATAGPHTRVIRQANSDVSDLIALSQCDLVVCSISSYSLWACTLSDARYIWFAPHLTMRDGRATIWGFEAGQAASESETNRYLEAAPRLRNFAPRGLAMNLEDTVPPELHAFITRQVSLRRPELDLTRYGSVEMQP